MNASTEYCREIEAHLCRKNGGHLIRIVGPTFELVSGWAERGIPLKVAFTGIDRYISRSHQRVSRRRPVRVEFCEADVLNAFDGWRRAVGVRASPAPTATDRETADAPEREPRRGATLASHIARALATITAMRGGGEGEATLGGDLLERIGRTLDALHDRAQRARGHVRDEVIAELAALDVEVLAAARAALGSANETQLVVEAQRELEPFRARMAADAYSRACDAAFVALIRHRFGLPRLIYE